jgi:hypothetical protein
MAAVEGVVALVLAQEGVNPLGDDLLPYLVLAIGGAMAVGSVLALVRPPAEREEGRLERAPVGRSVAFALVGAVGALWALASLVAG